MKSPRYFFGFMFALSLVHYLDAATTNYLIQNVQGEEINWTVDTSTFWTILFSPGPMLVFLAALWGLYSAECNPTEAVYRVHNNGWWRFLFASPYLYLSMITFVVTSNTSIVLGNGSFIGWLELFVGDQLFLGVCLMFSVWSMIALPFIERYLKRRFPLPLEMDPEESI